MEQQIDMWDVQAHGDEGKLRLALAVLLGRSVHAWRLDVGGEAILGVLDARKQVMKWVVLPQPQLWPQASG